MSDDFLELVQDIGKALVQRQWRCTVVESCTGGLLAATLTSVPGSSHWFEGGWITYSNAAKQTMLGVSEVVLAVHGAVSAETVCAMAEGALLHSEAMVSVAISGVAGPDGGTDRHPVGTVWIAWAHKHHATQTDCFYFAGDRAHVRHQAVNAALEGLLKLLMSNRFSL